MTNKTGQYMKAICISIDILNFAFRPFEILWDGPNDDFGFHLATIAIKPGRYLALFGVAIAMQPYFQIYVNLFYLWRILYDARWKRVFAHRWSLPHNDSASVTFKVKL